jgi:hypothetical protein
MTALPTSMTGETMYSLRSDVFCDYVMISMPKEDSAAFTEALLPYLDELGCTSDKLPGLYRLPDGVGTYKRTSRPLVDIHGFSGAFLQMLRDTGLFLTVLSLISEYPHRVTSADFTLDEYVPAPARIAEAYAHAVSGQLQFTRKCIPPTAVRQLLSPVAYDDSGTSTGTVYIGVRGRHEVFSKLYDKRQQIKQATGRDIPDTLRHELTVTSKMGITLRDVADPYKCFAHFYPAKLLAMDRTHKWEGNGEGFELNKRPDKLPAQILKKRVEDSQELESLLRIADKIGSEGRNYLLSLLAKKLKVSKNPQPLAIA